MSQQEENTLMELLTPFAGAVAGALALEKGPAMLGICDRAGASRHGATHSAREGAAFEVRLSRLR